MKPTTISTDAPKPRPPWRDAAPVYMTAADGTQAIFTVDDMYAHGLEGRTMAEAAEAAGVTAVVLRDALREHPVLRQAYDAGWDDWEAEGLRRAEVALAEKAEGFYRVVQKVSVHKGVVTRYREKVFFPPDTAAAMFKLERRDRERWGKETRTESPGLAAGLVERVSLYLEQQGHGALRLEAERRVDGGVA